MPLAGVEFGTQCYCGKAVKAGAAKAAASDCNMDCSGKSASPETCGGSYRSVVTWEGVDGACLERELRSNRVGRAERVREIHPTPRWQQCSCAYIPFLHTHLFQRRSLSHFFPFPLGPPFRCSLRFSACTRFAHLRPPSPTFAHLLSRLRSPSFAFVQHRHLPRLVLRRPRARPRPEAAPRGDGQPVPRRPARLHGLLQRLTPHRRSCRRRRLPHVPRREDSQPRHGRRAYPVSGPPRVQLVE